MMMDDTSHYLFSFTSKHNREFKQIPLVLFYTCFEWRNNHDTRNSGQQWGKSQCCPAHTVACCQCHTQQRATVLICDGHM